jgi:hypothetical protein
MSYTDHTNGAFLTRPGNYNVGKQVLDEVVTLSRYIDASVDNLTSAAFYKLWAVPANFVLLDAYVVVDTAEGASDTLDIVDDDSATTTFVTNVDLNTANGVTVTNARKKFSAAGFICMRPDAALTVCKFTVIIKGIVTNTNM